MKKILIILGFISAITAVVLAVTPLFKLSVFPVITGLVLGFLLIYLYRKKEVKTKAIQYIFLLSIIALSFTIYKSIFIEAEIGDVEQLDKLEDSSKEEAIKELEGIDIDS
ncbi:FUSC family protein [Winogradskyella litorisediminis]|uniref:FUSC family protein n=1 Tax=Winogradskyella litorisediminis TaxID=1156618 RepID=A0ABW3NBH6_9FLAO